MSKQTPENRLKFTINGFTPETLPLGAFAEYVAGLATLLGSHNDVHFVKVGKGSAALINDIDQAGVPAVRDRIHLVKNHEGPADAAAGFKRLAHLLARDKTSASISLGNSKILEFPRQEAVLDSTIGPISQSDYIDGQVIRVGGKDNTVPVYLRDEDDVIHACTATVEMAKDLGPYLYRQTIRVHGKGLWSRHDDGQWSMERFNIASFELLDDCSMIEAVSALRRVDRRDWPQDIAEKLTKFRAQE